MTRGYVPWSKHWWSLTPDSIISPQHALALASSIAKYIDWALWIHGKTNINTRKACNVYEGNFQVGQVASVEILIDSYCKSNVLECSWYHIFHRRTWSCLFKLILIQCIRFHLNARAAKDETIEKSGFGRSGLGAVWISRRSKVW